MKQLLTEIFQAYYTDVYTYLYSLCHNASLSEDLASEVFLDVVKSISTFRGESDIKTWLFTIARRKWIDWLRKQNRELKTESIHDLYDASLPGTEDPSYDLHALIQEILQSETELTRAIVALRLEGYSYYEIAQKHHISESSARVLYFRAKAKIKKFLEKEGIVP